MSFLRAEASVELKKGKCQKIKCDVMCVMSFA
jgi:hypothetical protein